MRRCSLLFASLALAACGSAPEALSPPPTTGSIQLGVTGLPSGTSASVSVSGPGAFARSLTGAATLDDLTPGAYTVSAQAVTAGPTTYVATPASQVVQVTASETPVAATIAYASGPQPGRLAVLVSGLPGGTNANVTVTGPAGFSRALAASDTLEGMTAGTYTVAAASVTNGGFTYAGAPASQQVTVAAGALATATLAYAPQGGRLAVLVSGLPGGTNASLTVTGPAGFNQSLTASDTLDGVAVGSYTLTAAGVTAGATNYAPSPASLVVSVTAGALASASVTYAVATPSTLNLMIDGLYTVQSVQSYNDTVPIVAGRDAMLRVFVRANQANTAAPAVRVRLYQGTNPTPVQTYTIPAPRASVPLAVVQDTLSASWNQLLPGSVLVPGLRILADVDPGNAVAEANEGDNSFPVTGSSRAMDVRTVSTMSVRFVPVTTAADGRTGVVTTANRDQFLASFRKMFPVQAVTSDVRSSAYTTTTTLPLESSNGNNAWGIILSEISTLRAAEGFTGYYYGVVDPAYGSGVAGIGYVPGRASVGWDNLPSGDGVAAHELGHNLSLFHAPCGGVSGADPGFPYAGGRTGVHGFDVAANALKLPTANDLMGYCGNNWISDYHYMKALLHRQASPVMSFVAAGPEPVLLVWGRVVRGEVVLEPAFEIEALPLLPAGRGAHVLEALDAAGRVRYSAAFDGELVADVEGGERHFSFTIPLRRLGGAPAQLRVRGRDGEALRQSALALRAGAAADAATLQRLQEPAAPRASRVAPDAVALAWDARTYPMALVRDAATGQILSFARGGDVRLVSAARDLDVTFSDGVRSRRERTVVR